MLRDCNFVETAQTFYCAAKLISYMYTYIPAGLDFLPI